jgi:hypothetical protein
LCRIYYELFTCNFLPVSRYVTTNLNIMKIKLSIFILFVLNVFVVHAQEVAPNKLDAAGKKQGHWIKFDANKKKVYDGKFCE